MYLGVDIGSTSSKAVVISAAGTVLGESIINIGTGSRGPRLAVEAALADAKIEEKDVLYCVATGYGRLTYEGANRQITEISCHAKGVNTRFRHAGTIIDIGGQDAKVIRLSERGSVENFVMNEKCAAGTGRFLEVMARVLDCGIEGLSDLSKEGKPGVTISSTCTVFAESEVISQLAAGRSQADVAVGVNASISEKIAGLCGRIGVVPEVVMTGGVAMNPSVVAAIEKQIGREVLVPENPQIMGALGAAVYARDYGTTLVKEE